ncbi:adenylate/guanylate cyclase domain-containing protein [Dactylosporangium sp. CA-092794]|uniref:adenylate/guanylate cyclase domain-containing protein n=1 Tax=Dactylosporangium sp. CA-092794 TaxID=3239929 RepID=UPI003D8B26FF
MNCASCDGVLPSNARFCPTCGAQNTPTVALEERKLVTVVFCDLVGSTALSEKLDPETLRSVVLRYFAAMRGQIERFDGTVEKFIGDAVMAVFGVPTMHEDDAHRAVAATLGMRAALARLNLDLEATLGVRLRVRIGVNTGPAVTSTDVSTRQALVSGDTVNVAARLEQNAAEGEILIGSLTQQAVGPAARTELVGPLRLKGKESAVIAYRLLGIDEDASELSRRFDLPFVGRTRELDEFDLALGIVATGRRPRLLTVYGEPGIGKTRLARAWLDRLDRPVIHGTGRCRPYGEDGSLAPLADVVHQVLARSGGRPDHADEALAVLSAGLLQDGSPGPSVEGTCAALARLLDAVSSEHPVVLILDDCQWASDPLLDVLDRLVDLPQQAAVLIVCLARLDLIDRHPGWGAGRPQLVLPGLSMAESEIMAATLVEVGAHLTTGPARVLEAAGGNPFYLEQLLAALSAGEHADDLPLSLQALLGARIGALDHVERTTLDLAAVLGREFAAQQVTDLADAGPEGTHGGPLAAGDDDHPVRTALTRLGRRRLVEPTGAASDRPGLRFSNGLIHEATYQAMVKRTRAERHERAADLLAASRTTTVTVADHLERAYRYRTELGLSTQATDDLRRRAAELLTAAGSQALARSDLAWAGTLLDRAVTLFVAGEPGWAAATRQLGEIRVATGQAADGRSLLRAVLDASPDPVETAHARLALAVVDPEPAVEAAAAVARETLPIFEVMRDDLGQARARIRMAQARQLHGRHAEADELLMIGLEHAVRRGAEPELALALGAIGVSLWRGPTPVPVAVARCRELLSEHAGPRPVVRLTLSCPLAVLLALDEQWAPARAQLDVARRLGAELGYAEGAAVLPIFAAAVESLAGQPGPALRLLDEAAAAAGRLGAGGLLSTVAREAARLLLDQGRPVEAAARLAQIGASSGLLRSDTADLDGLRARLAAADGRAAEAIDLAERAVSAAAATDSPIVQAVAALDQAATLRRLGRAEQAARSATAAAERFHTKGHRPGLRRAASEGADG